MSRGAGGLKCNSPGSTRLTSCAGQDSGRQLRTLCLWVVIRGYCRATSSRNPVVRTNGCAIGSTPASDTKTGKFPLNQASLEHAAWRPGRPGRLLPAGPSWSLLLGRRPCPPSPSHLSSPHSPGLQVTVALRRPPSADYLSPPFRKSRRLRMTCSTALARTVRRDGLLPAHAPGM